jgi:prepilin-type N-terminal cleavage/methylation domain-containing protein/prepilin-type processing-associated H-X9-DG protein
MTTRASRADRRGFTLVELLVVVGVIAVLIALLLPVLSAARRQGRVVVCLSNLRQLSAAFQLYVNENKGRGLQEVWELGPLTLEDHLLPPDRPRGVQSEAMFCPETTEPPVKLQGGGDPQNFWYIGETFRPWGMADAPYLERLNAPFRGSSYGMNGWLIHVSGRPPISDDGPYKRDMYIALPAKESSRVPLFADATWAYTFPLHDDPPPRNLNPHRVDGNMAYSLPRVVCIPRHGRAVNIVFLDGHARTVPLAELWQLKWNKVWVPTNVTLPPR